MHSTPCGWWPNPITAKSPTWHRRARAKRARQRLTIRHCRAAGKQPPLRYLTELAAHHSKPQFRELMGKQGSQKSWTGKWAGSQSWGGSTSWNATSSATQNPPYWDASNQWDGQNAKPGAGHGKEHLFPKYSDVKITGMNTAVQGVASHAQQRPGQDADSIKDVQKLINTIRKTDAKIRKCQETHNQRECQWLEFQQQLRRPSWNSARLT